MALTHVTHWELGTLENMTTEEIYYWTQQAVEFLKKITPDEHGK